MSLDETSDVEEVGTGIESFLLSALSSIQSALFDLDSRSLRPLFRLDMDDAAVRVLFDLPHVDRRDLSLYATEDVLTLEAKTRKPVGLRVRGGQPRQVLFERYTERVVLPARVTPRRAKAKFANGILIVEIPRARPRKALKIS